MKLTASILIASAQAQGRNREGKDSDNTNTDSASFTDAFADYFGGYDYGGSSFDYSGFDDSAFGNYNDAFGTDAPATLAATDAPTAAPTAAPTVAATEDPFAGYDFSGADDAFASYDGADNAANLDDTVADIVADVVDAAGRPDASDADQGKSSQFIQPPTIFEVDNTLHSTWCYVSEGDADFDIGESNAPLPNTAKDNWFDNGSWAVCAGANEVCQIKVTRKQNEISNIVSQCSNAHACVDNMRSNMNPKRAPYGSNLFFSSWKNQKCRPVFDSLTAVEFNGGANNGRRARGGSTPSECYYCVEPCRNSAVRDPNADLNDEATQRANMENSMCIGKSDQSEGVKNSLAFDTFDIFDETSHMTATASTYSVATQKDAPYDTRVLRMKKEDPNGVEIMQDLEISNIQIEQINILENGGALIESSPSVIV